MEHKPSAVESALPEKRVARRRLLQGGAALPLVLSITSRPAWAGGTHCSPSALASADLSGRHEIEGCGRSAGFWKTQQHQWPISISPSDDFVRTFGEVMYNGKVLYKGLTLGQAIHLSGNSGNKFSSQTDNPKNLAFPLIGALVNAHAFPSDDGRPGFPYTATDVIRMYQDLGHVAATGGDRALERAAEGLKNTLDSANNLYDGRTDWP